MPTHQESIVVRQHDSLKLVMVLKHFIVQDRGGDFHVQLVWSFVNEYGLLLG